MQRVMVTGTHRQTNVFALFRTVNEVASAHHYVLDGTFYISIQSVQITSQQLAIACDSHLRSELSQIGRKALCELPMENERRKCCLFQIEKKRKRKCHRQLLSKGTAWLSWTTPGGVCHSTHGLMAAGLWWNQFFSNCSWRTPVDFGVAWVWIRQHSTNNSKCARRPFFERAASSKKVCAAC